MIPNFYQCEFCFTSFVTESNYDKHSCKFKKRYEYIKSTGVGNLSFKFYKKWLSLQQRSTKYIDEHVFIHSPYFIAFKKFIHFVKTKDLPEVDGYMKYMIGENISPKFWSLDETYELYMDNYDTSISPMKHVENTVKTIFELTDIFECEPHEIFDYLKNREVLLLVKSRKLSPWFLLNSKCFKEYFTNSASAEERKYLHKFINPKKWGEIKKQNEETVEKIRNVVKELGM